MSHTPTDPHDASTDSKTGRKLPLWLKRMGWGGFWFFFIKGVVLYILLPLAAWFFGVDILEHAKDFLSSIF